MKGIVKKTVHGPIEIYVTHLLNAKIRWWD